MHSIMGIKIKGRVCTPGKKRKLRAMLKMRKTKGTISSTQASKITARIKGLKTAPAPMTAKPPRY